MADLNGRLQQQLAAAYQRDAAREAAIRADNELLRAAYLQRLKPHQGAPPEEVDKAIAELVANDRELMARAWADAVEDINIESQNNNLSGGAQ